MGLFDIFSDDSAKEHNEKKQQLMRLSEKELLVEVLLELKKANALFEDIKTNQFLHNYK